LAKIKVGDPLEESSNVGALINKGHLDKVVGLVERAVKQVRVIQYDLIELFCREQKFFAEANFSNQKASKRAFTLIQQS
jgi:acyl-CoA reductase-like NAD-dependent aldehyde dehydrogenase